MTYKTGRFVNYQLIGTYHDSESIRSIFHKIRHFYWIPHRSEEYRVTRGFCI